LCPEDENVMMMMIMLVHPRKVGGVVPSPIIIISTTTTTTTQPGPGIKTHLPQPTFNSGVRVSVCVMNVSTN